MSAICLPVHYKAMHLQSWERSWTVTLEESTDSFIGRRHEWKQENGFNNILAVQVRTDKVLKQHIQYSNRDDGTNLREIWE